MSRSEVPEDAGGGGGTTSSSSKGDAILLVDACVNDCPVPDPGTPAETVVDDAAGGCGICSFCSA